MLWAHFLAGAASHAPELKMHQLRNRAYAFRVLTPTSSLMDSLLETPAFLCQVRRAQRSAAHQRLCPERSNLLQIPSGAKFLHRLVLCSSYDFLLQTLGQVYKVITVAGNAYHEILEVCWSFLSFAEQLCANHVELHVVSAHVEEASYQLSQLLKGFWVFHDVRCEFLVKQCSTRFVPVALAHRPKHSSYAFLSLPLHWDTPSDTGMPAFLPSGLAPITLPKYTCTVWATNKLCEMLFLQAWVDSFQRAPLFYPPRP